MSLADAVARETAWLCTAGDGLPALLAEHDGPFDVVQGYHPRTPSSEQRSLYVMRRTLKSNRFAAVRRMAVHSFVLRLWWPASDGEGVMENDQAALDVAVGKVIARVAGPPFDKTHGGRFLSVAEGDSELAVSFSDPARSVPDLGALVAEISYSADDPETIG